MKKTKLLSLLLALIMLFSAFSAAIPVLAADASANAKELIDSFNGDMSLEQPSDEVLAEYNKMLAAFNALSQTERDGFDVYSFDKLLLAVYAREIVLWKKENNSTSTAEANKAAHKRAAAIISMPAYVAQAEALYTAANTISTQAQAEAFIEQLKTASQEAVILAGGYYNSYKLFRYSISEKYGSELIDHAADKISSLLQKADEANKPSAPKYAGKPNASKFEDGENDPAYIAAFESYLKYKEDNADYYVARYAYEGEKHYFAALNTVVGAIPEFAYLYDIAVASIAAKRSYNKDGGTEKIAELMAIYNSISDIQKIWIASVDNYIFAEKTIAAQTAFGIEYGYSYYKAPDLVDFCKSMEFYYTVKDFETLISALSEPYTNSDIAQAKEAYNAVPKSLQSSIAADVLAKYKNILAAIGPDDISTELPDLSGYTQTLIPRNKKLSDRTVDSLGSIITDILPLLIDMPEGGLSAFIAQNVYTSNTVGKLAKLLYPLLAGLSNLVEVTPQEFINTLGDEKYKGAVATLTAAVGENIDSAEAWNAEMSFANGDFGFADGDKEGFIDAVSALFRPLTILTMAIKFENSVNTTAGTYTYNVYEDLIPILEGLELRGIMSSPDYTAYVNNATSSNDKMQARLRPIVASVVDLIDRFGKEPMDVLLELLVNASYLITNENFLNEQLHRITSGFSFVSIGEYDLSAGGLYELIAPKLENIALAGTEISIKLDKERFVKLLGELAGCGTAIAKESVRRAQAYRLGIDVKKNDALSVLYYYLHTEITVSENLDTINRLLESLELNSFAKFAVKLVISVFKIGPAEQLLFFISLLLPLVKVFLSFSKFFSRFSQSC